MVKAKNDKPAASGIGGQGENGKDAPVGNSGVNESDSTSQSTSGPDLSSTPPSSHGSTEQASAPAVEKVESQVAGQDGADAHAACGEGFATAAFTAESPRSAMHTWAAANGLVSFSVAANADGYRRAGRAWSTVPETVSIDELDEEQVRMLGQDPNIKIKPLDVDGNELV